MAEKYCNSSAYTLLASISDENVEQKKYMLLAAESGNLAGMVAYGQLLILEGERETGVRWILRGAEGGQEMGQLFIAISYHYGIITPLDYDKAAYWYHRVIKEKRISLQQIIWVHFIWKLVTIAQHLNSSKGGRISYG